MDEITWRGE